MKFWEKTVPVVLDAEYDNKFVYTFEIMPSRGPRAGQELNYYLTFEKEEDVPPTALLWDFSASASLPKDQIAVIKEAQSRIESSGSNQGLQVWTVSFFTETETEEYEWGDYTHYELLDLQDPGTSITIMRTVESAVTSFIEQNQSEMDAITFSADTSDHGRLTLYARYAKMLEKQLGWKSLVGLDEFGASQIFISYDEGKLKAL